mgnify:CR=1 FL=1
MLYRYAREVLVFGQNSYDFQRNILFVSFNAKPCPFAIQMCFLFLTTFLFFYLNVYLALTRCHCLFVSCCFLSILSFGWLKYLLKMAHWYVWMHTTLEGQSGILLKCSILNIWVCRGMRNNCFYMCQIKEYTSIWCTPNLCIDDVWILHVRFPPSILLLFFHVSYSKGLNVIYLHVISYVLSLVHNCSQCLFYKL